MAEVQPSLFGDGSGWTGTIEDVSPMDPPSFPDYDRDESQAIRNFLLEEEGPAMAKRIYRREEQNDILQALMGQTIQNGQAPRLAFVHVDEKREMIDLNTGEIIDGAPGERIRERHLAKHMLHLEARNHAVGVVRGRKVGETEALWKEPKELGFSLTAHQSRLCADYLETIRLKSRRRAREARKRADESLSLAERWAQRMKWHQRYSWSLLTLTMPEVQGASIEQEERRILRAWTLFRKLDIFRLHIRAYIKGVEDSMKVGRPHLHIHSLIQSTFWDHLEIREAFFRCTDQATKEIYGFHLDKADLEARGVIGGVVLDIRAVRPKVWDAETEITMEDAIQETIKYITKSEDLTRLDPETLWEIELRERFGRMFEIGGACRASYDLEHRRLDLAVIRARRKVAACKEAWSQSARRSFLEARLSEIARELEAARSDPRVLRAERKALARELKGLRSAHARELGGLREALRRAEEALQAYRRGGMEPEAAEGGSSVHTTGITDGGKDPSDGLLPFDESDLWQHGIGLPPPAFASDEDPPDSNPRPPTWRQLMHLLSFRDWLHLMDERMRSALRYRGRMIREMFAGDFVTLEGRDVVMA